MNKTNTTFTIEPDGSPKLIMDDINKMYLGNAMAAAYNAVSPFIDWIADISVPDAAKEPYKNACDTAMTAFSQLANFMLFVGFTSEEIDKLLKIPF